MHKVFQNQQSRITAKQCKTDLVGKSASELSRCGLNAKLLAYSSSTCFKSSEYLVAGRRDISLSITNRCKLSWFDHVCRQDTLPKPLLQRTVEGVRRRGRPKGDNIKEWTDQ